MHDNKVVLAEAFTSLLRPKACLEKIPPELVIATGHEDEVFLFLLRIGDADVTLNALARIIDLSESKSVLATMARTGGLIKKRLQIDHALRLKARLEAAGAVIELIRPDEAE